MITEFTPLASLIGGTLIGLAAVLLMLFLGRIMGATGILAGTIFPNSREDWLWRVAVLVGMLVSPSLYKQVFGSAVTIDIPMSMPLVILGGLIVGVGVTLGSGCTSGHGVCGLARFSRRSIVAVLLFMSSTAITVYITRHVLDLSS